MKHMTKIALIRQFALYVNVIMHRVSCGSSVICVMNGLIGFVRALMKSHGVAQKMKNGSVPNALRKGVKLHIFKYGNIVHFVTLLLDFYYIHWIHMHLFLPVQGEKNHLYYFTCSVCDHKYSSCCELFVGLFLDCISFTLETYGVEVMCYSWICFYKELVYWTLMNIILWNQKDYKIFYC